MKYIKPIYEELDPRYDREYGETVPDIKDGIYHYRDKGYVLKVTSLGTEKTFQYRYMGKLHRENGPATIRYFDGIKSDEYWFKHGKSHNLEGPAVIRRDILSPLIHQSHSPQDKEQEQYHIEGRQYTKEEFIAKRERILIQDLHPEWDKNMVDDWLMISGVNEQQDRFQSQSDIIEALKRSIQKLKDSGKVDDRDLNHYDYDFDVTFSGGHANFVMRTTVDVGIIYKNGGLMDPDYWQEIRITNIDEDGFEVTDHNISDEWYTKEDQVYYDYDYYRNYEELEYTILKHVVHVYWAALGDSEYWEGFDNNPEQTEILRKEQAELKKEKIRIKKLNPDWDDEMLDNWLLVNKT